MRQVDLPPFNLISSRQQFVLIESISELQFYYYYYYYSHDYYHLVNLLLTIIYLYEGTNYNYNSTDKFYLRLWNNRA